jgi:UDP-N-acetyl-D-mannosaminuronic acid dehydrogenase
VEAELLPTDAFTAEVSKVVENTYRDVNVAFANEVALICESLKVNVHDVRRFVNSLPNDPTNPAANPIRNLHIPGAGVGGHCLPKDPWLLKYGLDTYGEKKFEPRILMESRRTNEYMPRHMSDLIEDAIRERQLKPKESKITILGYAFLENSDDPRNTPTIPLYEILKKQYKQVIVHDPYIKKGETIEILNDLNDAIKDSHCIAIVTRHREYTILTPEALLGLMKAPIIVDGRNTLNPKLFREKGFIFRGVGIP